MSSNIVFQIQQGGHYKKHTLKKGTLEECEKYLKSILPATLDNYSKRRGSFYAIETTQGWGLARVVRLTAA